MAFCREHLNRETSAVLKNRCFVCRPFILLRHILKLEALLCLRISSTTSFSDKPNWSSIASNGVRSSQAISMMRSVSCGLNNLNSFDIGFSYFTLKPTATVAAIFYIGPVLFPFFPPRKWPAANPAHFFRQVWLLHPFHVIITGTRLKSWYANRFYTSKKEIKRIKWKED